MTDSGEGEPGWGGGDPGLGIRRQERLFPSLRAQPLPSGVRRNILSTASSPRNQRQRKVGYKDLGEKEERNLRKQPR